MGAGVILKHINVYEPIRREMLFGDTCVMVLEDGSYKSHTICKLKVGTKTLQPSPNIINNTITGMIIILTSSS